MGKAERVHSALKEIQEIVPRIVERNMLRDFQNIGINVTVSVSCIMFLNHQDDKNHDKSNSILGSQRQGVPLSFPKG